MAKNSGKERGKSFRRIAEINRMVLNLIPHKTRQQLTYHPLLYFHAARANLMPELERSNDPTFNEYIELMMEYQRLQRYSQQQLCDYPIEQVSDKIVTFIRQKLQ